MEVHLPRLRVRVLPSAEPSLRPPGPHPMGFTPWLGSRLFPAVSQRAFMELVPQPELESRVGSGEAMIQVLSADPGWGGTGHGGHRPPMTRVEGMGSWRRTSPKASPKHLPTSDARTHLVPMQQAPGTLPAGPRPAGQAEKVPRPALWVRVRASREAPESLGSSNWDCLPIGHLTAF